MDNMNPIYFLLQHEIPCFKVGGRIAPMWARSIGKCLWKDESGEGMPQGFLGFILEVVALRSPGGTIHGVIQFDLRKVWLLEPFLLSRKI